MVRLGLADPLIIRLVQLPMTYFLQPQHQHVLFPTLIILCLDSSDEVNRLIIEDELSLSFLRLYVENVRRGIFESPSDNRMLLEKRIPESNLDSAMRLFE